MRWLAILALMMATGLLVSAESRSAEPDSNAAVDLGPIESAPQLLGTLGVGPSVLGKFQPDTPLDDADVEPLLRTLAALAQFPLEKSHRWAIDDLDAAQIAERGESLRGELSRLAGRAMRVEVIDVPPELEERFEVDRLYRCEIQLTGGATAIVVTPTIPQAWQLGADLNEPARFDGVFLKRAQRGEPGDAARGAELVFAASRIAWQPETPLGQLGMDVGLLDDIRQNRSIAGAEAEAFYQMLAAAGHANLNELLAATRSQQWTVIPETSNRDRLAAVLAKMKQENPALHFYFAGEPTEFTGELMAFEGQVYRCSRVEIADRELAERLGFDHYYDVIVFIDLDYRMKLVDGATGVEPRRDADRRPIPTEVTTYPIAAAVRHLPPGFPTGDRLKERVRVPGFFFKQWAYRSVAANALHPNRLERSPLIVGPGLEWVSKPQAEDSRWQVYAAAGFVFVLGLTAIVLWRAQRRDRQFRQTLRYDEPPSFDP